MPAMWIKPNEIFQISFMAIFCHIMPLQITSFVPTMVAQ